MFNIEDMNENIMWNCPDKETAYFFLTNNNGFYKNLNEDRFVPFEWILDKDKKTIKCYLNEVEDKAFFIHYLASEGDDYLCEIEEDGGVEEIVLIKELIEEKEEKDVSESLKDMDTIDKIFSGLFVVFSFMLFFLFFNFAPFFESIGLMYSLIFSVIVLVFLFKKIISLSVMMSKKHKDALKKLFME